MRHRTAMTALLALPLAALVACSSTSNTSTGGSTTSTGGSSGTTPDTSAAAVLPGSTWSLDSLGTSTTSGSVPSHPAAEAVLSFGEDKELNGSTGCNRFSGTYEASGTSLTIKLGPMTQVACAGPLLQAQEQAITSALPQVASFSTDDTTLTLKDASGKALLVYSAGLTDLAGTSWQIMGVNNGKGGVESTAVINELGLAFLEDGTFTTSGGCNNPGGSWDASGTDGLTMTVGPSTMMACADDVMTAETQFTAALGKVATYEISGSDLTMRDSSGATQVTAKLSEGPSGGSTTTAKK